MLKKEDEESKKEFIACKTLKMLIRKYACNAEIIGMGFADFTPEKKKFIVVINLSGSKEDVVAFSQFITHDEHGKINGFLVKFFVREVIH